MENTTQTERRVSPALWAGIAFLPFIFSWFTLRQGHTQRDRYIALGWLALLVVWGQVHPAAPRPAQAVVQTASSSSSSSSSPSSEPVELHGGYTAGEITFDCQEAIKNKLRDPEGVDFSWTRKAYGKTGMMGEMTGRNAFGQEVKETYACVAKNRHIVESHIFHQSFEATIRQMAN